METIEDVVLSNDKRGMTPLWPHLPRDFCTQAAQFILDRSGPVFIVTGFYEIVPHTIETDGPPGAFAIGRALLKLGRPVVYVVDEPSRSFIEPELDGASLEEFPITGPDESLAFARELLERHEPSVVLAIERCSLTEEGRYLNAPRQDIGEYTAMMDYLFTEHGDTVGIGDGGNEIGMGKLKDVIPTVEQLPDEPAATSATHLIITSVSNWGGYGLAAALSVLSGRNLLPTLEEESGVINRMVERGAVDGNLLVPIPSVDGFDLEVNLGVLQRLHDIVDATL